MDILLLKDFLKIKVVFQNLRKKENLEPIEELENINGSFIDQN